jgi:DNA (cytosine-5)-methyltransferase 1
VGGQCVFSSEWDKHAQINYEENFGEKPFGDITKIDPADIPDHDILLGGFPCQPFSICGDQKGFGDTRGTLFFNIEQILEKKRPYAFMLENVKRLVNHDSGRTLTVIKDHLERLGYTIYFKVLNTLDFGLPQKRERIIIVGFQDDIDFEFPDGSNIPKKTLEEILENHDDVDSRHFVSDKIFKKRIDRLKIDPPTPSIWHENKSGNISPLEYSCALRAGASYNYLLVDGKRRLTPLEMLRLQGFPDSYINKVPYTQIKKQLGNSVSVPVISAVAESMINAIEDKRRSRKQLDLLSREAI